MSEIKVNSIKGVGASAAAITVNNTDGTCTANLTNRTNKNLVINGACLIAQRGTSSTSSSYQTVDRFNPSFSGTDEAPTQAQVDVGTSDLPFTKGLTKALRITNGNQTSGAGAADYITIDTRLEAQDVRNSGWNYTSSSSFLTLSFYVKSSVAQNFYGYLKTFDGSSKTYTFETGSLTADTWTKITKTISGNSDLSFDNDANLGLQFLIAPFWGTNYTASVTLNQWNTADNAARTPDSTSTWYTTNDATFEITGVQLEVGSVATDFEHRSFGQELALCTRYCQIFHVPNSNSYRATGITATVHGAGNGVYLNTPFLPMRAAPSLTVDGAFGGNVFTGSWSGVTLSSFSAGFVTDPLSTYGFHGVSSASISSSQTTGLTGHIYTNNNGSDDAALIFSAEL